MLRLVQKMVSSRWYILFVFGCWSFGPEVRRFIDWQSSFHSLSIVAVLPLASLLPGVVLFRSAWERLGPGYQAIFRFWALAFGYSAVITIFRGSLLPAFYDLALFGLPLFLGALLVQRPTENLTLDYNRVANIILWTAVAASVYGIVQYVAPPAWDVYWAQNAQILSQGEVVAFGFRIFGPLNSPAILADYLVFAVLINLPRLKLSEWRLSLMITPCMIALVLTSVRALWVTLAAGVLIYLLLSPRRRDLMLSLGAVVAVVILAATVLTFTIGGAERALTTATDRVATFGALDTDSSAMERGTETTQALREGFQEPLGQGLGVLGTALKLSDQGGDLQSLDNGFLTRFVEMGVVGFALYLVALAIAISTTFKSYSLYRTAGNLGPAAIMATSLALQFSLLIAEIFGDHHAGLAGLFFWFTIYFASAYAAPLGVRREATRSLAGVSVPPRLGWSS